MLKCTEECVKFLGMSDIPTNRGTFKAVAPIDLRLYLPTSRFSKGNKVIINPKFPISRYRLKTVTCTELAILAVTTVRLKASVLSLAPTTSIS